jgi:hypothetical protein
MELYKEHRESDSELLSEDHIWIDLHEATPLDGPEAKQQIKDFAPDVKVIGPGMIGERRGSRVYTFGRGRPWKPWGGAFARAVESTGDKGRRCLQYVYVYTRQRGVTSLFWMTVLPILMFLWGQLVLIELTGLVLLLALILPVLPLLWMSLAIHWTDRSNPEGSKFALRSTTWSIAYSLMLIASFFNQILLYLLLWAAAGFFVVWVLELFYPNELPQAHEMDYVPVFIWIRKTNGAWDYEKLCWDVFHYHSEPLINTELKILEAEEVPRERVGAMQRRLGKDWSQMQTIYTVNPEQKAWVQTVRDRVQQRAPPVVSEPVVTLDLAGIEDTPKPLRFRLEIPDSWHAMELERQSKENYLVLGIVGCFISALLLIPFLLGAFSPFFGTNIFVNTFFYIVLPAVFVQSGLGIVRARFNLLGRDEEHLELTDNKLRIMWNLEDEPRLKIVTKLQDPFNDDAFPDDGFSFNDDPYHLYSLIPKHRKSGLG